METQENKAEAVPLPGQKPPLRHWRRIPVQLLLTVAERAAEEAAEGSSLDDICRYLADEYAVEIHKSTLQRKLRTDWAEVAEEKRAKADAQTATIWVARKSQRLKAYARLAEKAEEEKKFRDAAQIVFLAAKELGQVVEKGEFRHEHNWEAEFRNGEPMGIPELGTRMADPATLVN